MAFGNDYKKLYFEAERKRIQGDEKNLKKEGVWNKEKGELLTQAGVILERCHVAEQGMQVAMVKQQEAEGETIKSNQDYNKMYNENINLKNNAECNKSASATILKNTSLIIEKCKA